MLRCVATFGNCLRCLPRLEMEKLNLWCFWYARFFGMKVLNLDGNSKKVMMVSCFVVTLIGDCKTQCKKMVIVLGIVLDGV